VNIPNALTLFRIFLVPAFLIALIEDEILIALLIFLCAGVTDLLDGFFARCFAQETRLGLYLDPVADKLLMTVSFVSLAIKGIFPPWLAVLVVTKDLFVSIGVGILYFAGQSVNTVPTLWGKQTTFLQILTVIAALLATMDHFSIKYLMPLFILTAGVTAFSGCHYILSGLRSFPADSQS